MLIIASDRFYRQNESTEKEVFYFDVEAWARLGRACAENLKKGRGMRVVGRLKIFSKYPNYRVLAKVSFLENRIGIGLHYRHKRDISAVLRGPKVASMPVSEQTTSYNGSHGGNE
jgi:hypothetical protein